MVQDIFAQGRKEELRRILFMQGMVAIGAVVAALAYALFQVPFQLAAGGVSGLGIIVHHYTGWPVGTLYLLLNIPLISYGYRHLGRGRFLFSTLWAVVVFSVAADLFSATLPTFLRRFPLTFDMLLNAIYAGILYGLGTGLIYRAGGTIGGTSIPANIFHKKTGFPLSQSYLFTDLGVIALAGLVFSWERAMLAFLSLILGGLVSDYVLEGASNVRTAMIITRKPETLSRALMNELQKGVSAWGVTGAFTHTQRTMLYCTVRRSQITELKQVLGKVDPDAFFVIGMAQQAYGGIGLPHLNGKKGLEQKERSLREEARALADEDAPNAASPATAPLTGIAGTDDGLSCRGGC